MFVRRTRAFVYAFAHAFAFAAVLSSGLAPAQEPVDLDMVAKIRAEGMERSKVNATFLQFTEVFGPRLTASPAMNASARWARDKMEEWGLADPRLETWEFGRGWSLEGFTLEMIEPRFMPLIGYPVAWSPSTDGVIEAAPILATGLSQEEVAALGDRLRGAIVLTRPEQRSFIRTDRDPPPNDPPPPGRSLARDANYDGMGAAQQAQQRRGERRGGQQRGGRRGGGGQRGGGISEAAMRQAGVAVTLAPSRGEHGTLFVSGRDRGDDVIPSVVVQAEHYNLIARLIELGRPVKLRVGVRSQFHEDDTNGYNVLAEIPGADPAIGDQVVMVGAHLDSWHGATGATDNADGSAVAMEAMRILKALDVKPRRTIRVGLWSGEEQGLHGSRHYVQDRLSDAAAREKFSVYFNLDPGAGPIYGWFLEGNAAMHPILAVWMKPFDDLYPVTLTMRGIGSTDHLNFRRVGLPGFQAIHDYVGYDVREHHTNMDFAERVEESELIQASVVMASILYHAAMRDEMIPR
jgi:hypothetical protein